MLKCGENIRPILCVDVIFVGNLITFSVVKDFRKSIDI